jgi:hypothetical protein
MFGQERENKTRDVVVLLVQGKMGGVEQVDFGIRQSVKSHCRTGADTATSLPLSSCSSFAWASFTLMKASWRPSQLRASWAGPVIQLRLRQSTAGLSIPFSGKLGRCWTSACALSSGVAGNTRPIRALAKRQWALISLPCINHTEESNGGKQHVEQDVLP